MNTIPATQLTHQDNTQTFPLWFNAMTGLLVVSNLFIFGILTLVNPLGTFLQSDTSAIFPIQFFAVRHIALSVPLIHGLLTRNMIVLRTMYTVFVIISVLDISLLVINGYYIPLIGELPQMATVALAISLFFLPMALGLRYLRSVRQ